MKRIQAMAVVAGLVTGIVMTSASGPGKLGAIAPLVAQAETLTALNHKQATKPQASSITEAQVRQILNEMQTAVNKRSVADLVKFIAPNAVIEVNMQTMAGSQRVRLNREEYSQYLQQSYDLMENYRYKISNLKIKIAPNKKTATASYVLREEATVQNQAMTVHSTSLMKLAVMQNRILVTSLSATSTVNLQTSEVSKTSEI